MFRFETYILVAVADYTHLDYHEDNDVVCST